MATTADEVEIQTLRDKNYSLSHRIEKIAEQLTAVTADRDDKHRQIQLREAHKKELDRQLAAVTADRDDKHRQIQSRDAHTRELDRKLAEVTSDRDDKHKQILSRDAHTRELDRKIAELIADRDYQNKQLQLREVHNQELDRKIADLKAEIIQLKNIQANLEDRLNVQIMAYMREADSLKDSSSKLALSILERIFKIAEEHEQAYDLYVDIKLNNQSYRSIISSVAAWPDNIKKRFKTSFKFAFCEAMIQQEDKLYTKALATFEDALAKAARASKPDREPIINAIAELKIIIERDRKAEQRAKIIAEVEKAINNFKAEMKVIADSRISTFTEASQALIKLNTLQDVFNQNTIMAQEEQLLKVNLQKNIASQLNADLENKRFELNYDEHHRKFLSFDRAIANNDLDALQDIEAKLKNLKTTLKQAAITNKIQENKVIVLESQINSLIPKAGPRRLAIQAENSFTANEHRLNNIARQVVENKPKNFKDPAEVNKAILVLNNCLESLMPESRFTEGAQKEVAIKLKQEILALLKISNDKLFNFLYDAGINLLNQPYDDLLSSKIILESCRVNSLRKLEAFTEPEHLERAKYFRKMVSEFEAKLIMAAETEYQQALNEYSGNLLQALANLYRSSIIIKQGYAELRDLQMKLQNKISTLNANIIKQLFSYYNDSFDKFNFTECLSIAQVTHKIAELKEHANNCKKELNAAYISDTTKYNYNKEIDRLYQISIKNADEKIDIISRETTNMLVVEINTKLADIKFSLCKNQAEIDELKLNVTNTRAMFQDKITKLNLKPLYQDELQQNLNANIARLDLHVNYRLIELEAGAAYNTMKQYNFSEVAILKDYLAELNFFQAIKATAITGISSIKVEKDKKDVVTKILNSIEQLSLTKLEELDTRFKNNCFKKLEIAYSDSCGAMPKECISKKVLDFVVDFSHQFSDQELKANINVLMLDIFKHGLNAVLLPRILFLLSLDKRLIPFSEVNQLRNNCPIIFQTIRVLYSMIAETDGAELEEMITRLEKNLDSLTEYSKVGYVQQLIDYINISYIIPQKAYASSDGVYHMVAVVSEIFHRNGAGIARAEKLKRDIANVENLEDLKMILLDHFLPKNGKYTVTLADGVEVTRAVKHTRDSLDTKLLTDLSIQPVMNDIFSYEFTGNVTHNLALLSQSPGLDFKWKRLCK